MANILYIDCTLLSLVIGVTRASQRQSGTFIDIVCYLLWQICVVLNAKTYDSYDKKHMIALFCFRLETPWLYAVVARR